MTPSTASTACCLNSRLRLLAVGLLALSLALAARPALAAEDVLTADQKKAVEAADKAIKDCGDFCRAQKALDAELETVLKSQLGEWNCAAEFRVKLLTECLGKLTAPAKLAEEAGKHKTALEAAKKTIDAEVAKLKDATDETKKKQKKLLEETAAKLGVPKDLTPLCTTDGQPQLKLVKPYPATLKSGMLKSFEASLADLKGFAEMEPQKDPLGFVAKVMPTIFPSYQSVGNLTQCWKDLSPKLTDMLGADEADCKAISETVPVLAKRCETAALRADDWVDCLVKLPELQGLAKQLKDMRADVRSHPELNGEAATKLCATASQQIRQVQSVCNGYDSLVADFRSHGDPLTEVTKPKNVEPRLLNLKTLRDAAAPELALLEDQCLGGGKGYVFERVNLYYFPDVRRLMQLVSQVGSEPEVIGAEAAEQAEKAAKTARRQLADAELDVLEAGGTVSDLRQRLKDLQDELEQARAARDASQRLLTLCDRRVAKTAKELVAANEKLDLAEASTSADREALVKKAEEEVAKVEARQSEQAEEQKDLTDDRDTALARADALGNEETGLPKQIDDAKAKLATAEGALRVCLRTATLASTVEAEAFAQQRDNAPLLRISGIASSSDLARRVTLYALGDCKTLFLYGPQIAVTAAKERIAQLDRPSAQAKLTLWALELNCGGGDMSARMNKSISEIDKEMAFTRACHAATLSVLRSCLNQVVLECANEEEDKACGDPEVLRLRRFAFYSRDVRTMLGLVAREYHDITPDERTLTRWTLPDPAASSTLGETLIILSLGQTRERERVFELAEERLSSEVAVLAREYGIKGAVKSGNNRLMCLRMAMEGRTSTASGRCEGCGRHCRRPEHTTMTPLQMEIVRTLQRTAVERIAEYIEAQVSKIPDLSQEDRISTMTSLMPLFAWLKELDIPFPSLPKWSEDRAQAFVQVEKTVAAGKYELSLKFPESTLTARIAAADQMVKELVLAVDDDLERDYVRPMLDRISGKLANKYVQLGIVQRTSILGLNRQACRVEATATSQLALEQGIDALAELEQAVQIYAAAQSAGLLGGIWAGKGLPQERGPEMYSLTSRGGLQVTPIVDPSGQALQFRFDHVSNNMVREPNGTVNPKIPRVERHTVNTDVQLSSMEIREISRYAVNSRLGLPTERSGGLPILRHVPILKELPIIGWFKRRSAKAGSVQESIVLGQATVFPTILEMSNLMVLPKAQAN